MKTIPSAALSHYLSRQADPDKPTNPSAHLAEGAAQVSADDLAGLIGLLPQIAAKVARLAESARLRRRLDVLAQFFAETEGQGGTPERREVAFGLYYFLKGFDLIPDSVPEIGLVDDALLVDTIFSRNQHALRAHWAARGRPALPGFPS